MTPTTFPPRLEGGIGHQAHQTDPTAAINHGYAFLGQKLAQPPATSRPAGSAPKRAPQKTQMEEGTVSFSTRTGNGRFYLQTIRRLSGPGRHGIISQREVATPMGAGSRTVGRVMSRTVIWLVVGRRDRYRGRPGRGVAWRVSEQAVLDKPTKPTPPRRRRAVAPSSASHPAAPPGAGRHRTRAASRGGAHLRHRQDRAGRPRRDRRPRQAGRQDRPAGWRQGDRARRGRCSAANGSSSPRIRRSRPGQHELRVVQHIEGRAPVTSEQVVVAVVPSAAGATRPRRRDSRRGRDAGDDRAAWRRAGEAGAAAVGGRRAEIGRPRVSTLDYDDARPCHVTGQATPGVVVRAYINDNLVAEGAGRRRRPLEARAARPDRPGQAHAAARSAGERRQAGGAPRAAVRSRRVPPSTKEVAAWSWCAATICGTSRAPTTAWASITR